MVEPRAPVSEHDTMLVNLADELLRLGFIAVDFSAGITPGGEKIPTRSARCLGIWRDHRNAGLDQILPISNGLRIALSDEKYNCRRVWSRSLEAASANRRESTALSRRSHQCRRQRQGHYVRFEPSITARACRPNRHGTRTAIVSPVLAFQSAINCSLMAR